MSKRTFEYWAEDGSILASVTVYEESIINAEKLSVIVADAIIDMVGEEIFDCYSEEVD